MSTRTILTIIASLLLFATLVAAGKAKKDTPGSAPEFTRTVN